MSFLGKLADQISSQFSVGENTSNTLDAVVEGQQSKYGSLGDFASKFDQSSERRYVEEGYLRKDPYNTDPKQYEILMQEPNASVLIKKKMFSSIGDNFRPDFMDADEKLYYKTMRILFSNKCHQISALEKLSKIQKITSSVGSVHDQLVPIIISLTDSLNNGLDQGSNLFGAFGSSTNPLASGASSFTNVVDRLRRVYAFTNTSQFTSWITDNTNIFQSQFGQGTGVIEITNFTNVSTTVSTELNSPGSFNLTISDPYESMLITEYDIEKAISDATNMFYNRKIFQFGKESAENVANDILARLNQYRANRGASPISLKINPDTLLGKRVVAILDRIGEEIAFTYDSTSGASLISGGAFGNGVTVAPEYMRGGAIAGNDGLDSNKIKFNFIKSFIKHTGPDSELSLFNRLITTIFSKISLDANSRNSFQLNNQFTNYVRRKMRFNFAGKLIIQPMDVVHIYMNSKSRFDSKLSAGLNNMFTGLGVLQNLNNTLTDFKQQTDSLFNPSGSIPLQIEKSVFVGADFPNYLWSLLRGSFVSEQEGTHVFAGVVDNATDNWGDGKFTIDVRGRDNTIYFDQGKVNFKPGVDIFNGAIFDPLTPFKTNFDTVANNTDNKIPELLDENKYLLATNSAGIAGAHQQGTGLVKFKLGRYAGQLISGSNIIQDRSLDPVTGRITKVFYAPDGLVYKWKEGIGIFTQFGSNLEMNNPNRVGSPNTFNEPFAGQDIMNVLSLLVTGVPYNFATYFKTNLDSFNRDPQSNQDAAHSYAASLRNDLARTNTLWGNFIPFKNLVIDEASYSQALQKQTTIIQRNQDLDVQINKLQDLNREAILWGAASALSATTVDKIPSQKFMAVKEQIRLLQAQIDKTISSIAKEDSDTTHQVGDDTSFDFTAFIDSSKVGKSASDPSIRRYLRRQINFLTKRMSYNVRANEDKNLFIVDDSYDKDFDILAYEQSLTDGIKLYNSEFTSVREKIMNTASLLNLEVFCDTQGHIRVRPPQYNRMPSSVFYRMMYLKQALGIQVFPQFLDDLFKTKLDSLKIRLEILEDQIRLDCAILEYNDDTSATEFILSGVKNLGDSFSFISDPGTASQNFADGGSISEINSLLIAANPDQRDSNIPQALAQFSDIELQSKSTKDVFTNSQKYSAIISSLEKHKLSSGGVPIKSEDITSPILNNTRIDYLISRIQTKSGQRIDKKDYIVKTSSQILGLQLPLNATVDVFKVIQELSDKIKERQKVLKLFYSTLRNAQEFKALDASKSTGNELLTPGIFGNSNIPEVFEHMIEDESYDDYGLGSGRRYVIRRSQIKNINISENPPPFTTVEVQGIMNPFSPKAVPEGLNAFPNGGNGLVTALAIDYDMWRNYGFKEPAVLSVPFLSDPISQCGPYASMILSRNRKNILRGTVTIAGNEFMQPGEVVFLEDRAMLFYVTAVRHSFSFGSTFNTTLDLSYGHTPGEYIPTVMDVIGKIIYNNKDAADLVVQRQDTSGNDINIGVVQMSGNSTDVLSSSTFNAQTINNILYTAAYLTNANSVSGSAATTKIELRTYHDKNPVDSNLLDFANSLRKILVGEDINSLKKTAIGNPSIPPVPLNPKDVELVSKTTVNMDNHDDRRSPSQKAIDAARNNTNNSKSSSSSTAQAGTIETQLQQDKIRSALFSYIVDCWITIIPNDNISQKKTF